MKSLMFELRCPLGITPENFLDGRTAQDTLRELKPLFYIIVPNAWHYLLLREMPHDLHRACLVLFFGFLPVDVHLYGTFNYSPSVGFTESSASWLNKQWIHQRTVTATKDGCEVTDKVTFEPRVPFLSPLFLHIHKSLFKYRHKQLVKRYPIN